MYGLKYTVPFESIDGVGYEVNLEVLGYVGDPIELVGGGSPFVVDTDTDDLNAPMRMSKATLQVYGSDYLQDLYASNPQGIRVTLLKNGSVEWLGYVTPDTFSQDFSKKEFTYDVECVCALSTLKYKKFSSDADIISFRQLMSDAANLAGYSSVVATYAMTTPDNELLIDAASVATSNFIDEMGEAMSYYEILEDMAKFMGCTFTPFRQSLLLLDYLAIKNGNNVYSVHNGSEITGTVLYDAKSTLSAGFKGTGASISRIPGKNKVSVVCSLYEVDSVLPAFDDEQSQFVSSEESDETASESGKNVTYHSILRRYNQPKYTFFRYTRPNYPAWTLGEHTDAILPEEVGSGFVRTVRFDKANPPAKLDFVNEVVNQHLSGVSTAGAGPGVEMPVVKIRSPKKVVTNPSVYLCLSMGVKFRAYTQAGMDSRTAKWSENKAISIKCKLRLGDLYFNGSEWVASDTTFQAYMDAASGEYVFDRYYTLRNTNTYTLGVGDLTGLVVPCPSQVVWGFCELTVYAPLIGYFSSLYPVADPKYIKFTIIDSFYKDIKLDYAIANEASIYGDWVKDGSKNDVTYENVIEGDYIEEADEVNLKICTNPDNKLCHSSVMSHGQYLTEVKSLSLDKTALAEHLIIERQVAMFSRPRYSINPTLGNNIKPYSKITDANLPGVVFMAAGGEENFKMDSVKINLIEL